VALNRGSGAARAARMLRRRGLIRSERAFYWYALITGKASSIKAGVYHLTPHMPASEILARLQRGGADIDERTVTIPEGYTVRQIAAVLQRKGVIADAQQFIVLARKPGDAIHASFAIPKAGLEGYLFPETYSFLPNSRPEAVAQVMVDTFSSRFLEPYRADISRSPHSLNDIVTIASLIEREAETPGDRPRIAGVIENRLRVGMKLDIDASVLYALGHHKTRVFYKDLAVRSPYNTYRHKGLPPGPIASAGIPSLRAALAPERHAYLFYVASPDGSHVFTRTEAEHNRAVARMRALMRTETPAVKPAVTPAP